MEKCFQDKCKFLLKFIPNSGSLDIKFKCYFYFGWYFIIFFGFNINLKFFIYNCDLNYAFKDEKYYDIGDIYIGYGNPQTNILYLQYKWIDGLENPNLNTNSIERKETNEVNLDKEAASVNKKSEKNIDKFFNNSSMMISEIKDNTDKSMIFIYS